MATKTTTITSIAPGPFSVRHGDDLIAFSPKQTRECPAEVAQMLIDAGRAVPADSPADETATQGPTENASTGPSDTKKAPAKKKPSKKAGSKKAEPKKDATDDDGDDAGDGDDGGDA